VYGVSDASSKVAMSFERGNQDQKQPKRFEGKVALITGAAGALGSTTARLFSQEGARIVLCDLPNTEPKLQQLVTELLSLGSPAVIYDCGNVSNVEDVKKSVQRSVDEFGGIDILFNNAAICPVGPLQLTDEAMFKKVQDVNVYGVFLMMKYVSNKMIESGKGGVILNVSSIAGIKGTEILFAYCASKFAVSGMTRAAAKSLAKNNIRVCAIAPHGLEGTKMADDTLDYMTELSKYSVIYSVSVRVICGPLNKNLTSAMQIQHGRTHAPSPFQRSFCGEAKS